jgi:hypothetical protein
MPKTLDQRALNYARNKPDDQIVPVIALRYDPVQSAQA